MLTLTLKTTTIIFRTKSYQREHCENKPVRKGQLFHLPICSIHRLLVDPESRRRPLEIREPHAVQMQILKSKMKLNPHATVVPFLIMVDPNQCPIVADFKYKWADDYTYYVIGGSHSDEARRQLVKEYPLTPYFKYAECKVYVGLTLNNYLGTIKMIMIIDRRCHVSSESDFSITSTSMHYKNMVQDYI